MRVQKQNVKAGTTIIKNTKNVKAVQQHIKHVKAGTTIIKKLKNVTASTTTNKSQQKTLRRVQQQITTNNAVLVARGGLKSLIPAINLDTLRGRRKGDPQHKCCGKKHDQKTAPQIDRTGFVFLRLPPYPLSGAAGAAAGGRRLNYAIERDLCTFVFT